MRDTVPRDPYAGRRRNNKLEFDERTGAHRPVGGLNRAICAISVHRMSPRVDEIATRIIE